MKIRLLEVHNTVHTQGVAGRDDRVPGVKAKMDAPKLQLGVDQQMWDQFMTRWKIFKTTMGVDGATAPSWLFNCLDKDLGDEVIKANPGTEPQNMTEAVLTASIKRLAVKVESKLLHRIKMGKLQQDPGVSVNNYLAALRGQSRQCQYEVQCSSCNAQTDYSEEVILDQLIRGLHNQDIVAELIGDEKTDRTLLETVEFIARKEQATLERAQVGVEGDSVSAVKQTTPVSSRKRCRFCQGESHGADSVIVRREKCPAWDNKCSKCQVKGHYEKVCYKCKDCGKWGHRNKHSRWCDTDGDKQSTDDEVGVMLSAMTMQPRRRGGRKRKRSAPKQELRRVPFASKQRQVPVAEKEPRQEPTARYRHTSTKLLASKSCQTPNASTDRNTESSFKGSHQFQGAPPVSRGSTSFKELHQRRNVVQNTFKDEEYNSVRDTQVGDNKIVSEIAKFSPLDYNGAILPPGYGTLGTRVNYHSTPVPVNSAATTSTVTVSTSPVSVTGSQWEHYKFWVPTPQVGQLDPIRFGSPVIQPTMWGTPLTLSQHEWPNLPTPLRKMVPTVQTNTTADALYVKESVSDAALENPDGQEIYEYDQMSGAVLPIPVKLDNSVLAHQEGEVNTEVDTVPVAREEEVHTAIVNVDSDASNVATQVDTANNDAVDAVNDNNATTIAELECPYDNCKYVTGVGQDCVQYGMDMYAAKMEMEHELRVHIGGTHTENVAAARITASKGRNKSSGRPHGSKKRDKSRRWALQYEEGDEIC